MRSAGFGTGDLIDAAGVLGTEITVFNDRVRIDVQTHARGLSFEAAGAGLELMEDQDQPSRSSSSAAVT